MTRVLLSVPLLGALSCSDPSEPNLLGNLTFTFTGAGGGTYSASGNAPSTAGAPPTGTSWVAGYQDAGETYVLASNPRSGVLVDLAILRFERTTTGSETIDAACDIDGGIACTSMELLLNFNGNGDTGDFFCVLTTGTIVLAEITSSRAKGTFSGTGDCFAGTGGAATAFSVSNGTFDLAVVAPPP